MLLEWTSTGGYELRAATPGPHGLTALHLAAVLKDSGKLAALLTGALLPLVHAAFCTSVCCGSSRPVTASSTSFLFASWHISLKCSAAASCGV